MRIRLYLDEDAMGNPLVRALRSRGIELVTALEVGMIEKEDKELIDDSTYSGFWSLLPVISLAGGVWWHTNRARYIYCQLFPRH